MSAELSASFWQIIAESKGDPDQLKTVLEAKSDDEIRAFVVDYMQGLINLNEWRLWGAGYVIAGGMSDDSFHYFRSWILGKGKEAYDLALSNPDELGKFVVTEEDEEVENELLEYVAVDIFEERGLDEDPRDASEGNPDGEPRGDAWDEDEVYSMFPKLAKRFGDE